MYKLWIIVLVSVCLIGCDGDDSDDENNVTEAELNYGASRMLALEPATGELRWGIDFQGEALDFFHFYPDGKSVAVAAIDSCFPAKQRLLSFTIDEGRRTTFVRPTQNPPTNYCGSVAVPGVTNFKYVNGYCVGIEVVSGDLVALDTVDNAEVWRTKLGVSSHFVFGTVLLALSEIAVGDQVHFRVQRVEVTNGSVIWKYQQVKKMVPMGANAEFVFMLDTRVFALTTPTGDLGWVHLENWEFVPEHDGGELFGNTLLVKRQYFLESLCTEE